MIIAREENGIKMPAVSEIKAEIKSDGGDDLRASQLVNFLIQNEAIEVAVKIKDRCKKSKYRKLSNIPKT